MPPLPKDPSVRARRNKSSTRATLSADHDVVAPELPDGVVWHPLTVRWWNDIWASPMAPEYTDSDINGLFRVAMLYNDFWTADTAKARAEAQVRLEKADTDYGTNPLARRRLEWQIEATEDSKAKGSKRRKSEAAPVSHPVPGDDPRLKLVT
ncbi:minor tail protein [Mycobacterium phage Filuzino]|uniref:Terminase small subunit n=2 Tax=Cheoctovirus TaxID=1623281 RepID=A0A385DMW7_9CAUD|nr:minor tail protein [Mycobacterium phage EleanorGeorge]YP_009956990.1 minor tail protein [Mycobacterium phage Filuzino]AXQ60701.1 terminase small subunit [Mycobacterium phage EleanorGeorge]AYQ99352.1 hypothetical protein PBI_FILUZINO_1 [Mycobacterium phage Filuzino]QYC54787.1 terminase small subunit [Mycobacterium phage Zizzle]